ncbi:MAG: protein translocase subunit SecDF [Cytophagales bacterium]
MKNKGFVVALTIIITLLCIYYLSFTFVSRNVAKEATEYAKDSTGTVDFGRKQKYLDSLWTAPVYNLLGLEFTLKEVKQTELNFGLDLQGGMHVTLEVSPIEIIKTMAGNSTDPKFNEALKNAREAQRNSQDKFIDLFYAEYQKINPGVKLSSYFSNTANRGRIDYSSSDDEVLKVVGAEIDDAIDRTFTILRTRIDKFGVTQPNIQQLEGTNRIQVELPGVDNPERVRKLLQGVAKLEFFEVYEPNEFIEFYVQANDYLVEKEKAEKALEEGNNSKASELSAEPGDLEISDEPLTLDIDDDMDDDPALLEDDTSEPVSDGLGFDEDSSSDALALDSGTSAQDSLAQQEYSILLTGVDPNSGRLFFPGKDTAEINEIMRNPKIKAFFPPSLEFLWSVKPIGTSQAGEEIFELFPIRKGRNGKAPLEGDVITNANSDIAQDGRGYEINMQMNSRGAKVWKRLTAENIDRQIAIVLDNRVYSVPTVQNEIPGGRSAISGAFTLEESKDLANILKAGALPAPARIVEEAIVGSTLGDESIRQGITSILAGLVLVILFMVLYYNKGGLVADIALFINIFFILGILAQLNAALTLPGIAGIVLTIGMSIDANVLIFERIREELRAQKSLLNAIKLGYEKAFSSILDSNVTTFLTGVILYTFGSGPVKGFAVTLMIGIACSFFSAVFITRVIVEWMTRKNKEGGINFSTFISKNLLSDLNLNIIGKRKMAYIGSTILIIFGMSTIFLQNGLNLGVDFTGGRSFVVQFDEPVSVPDVRTNLSNSFDNASVEVKTYGSNNTIKITTGYLVDDESAEADEKVNASLMSGLDEYKDQNPKVLSSSKVGATIADDIKSTAQESVIFSLIVIFLYILIRFRKWQFGLGAIVALFHDVLVVLSMMSIMRLLGVAYEVDQVFIAAMLTIIGYSINDTVVVFDRVREYLQEHFKSNLAETLNLSINSTLNRTVMTSLTTLLVVLILFLFGGEALRGFSFALLIGILVGTYSSIFIATPIVVETSKKQLIADAKKAAK